MVPVHYQSGNIKPLCKLADYLMCIFDPSNVLFIQSKHEKKKNRFNQYNPGFPQLLQPHILTATRLLEITLGWYFMKGYFDIHCHEIPQNKGNSEAWVQLGKLNSTYNYKRIACGTS